MQEVHEFLMRKFLPRCLFNIGVRDLKATVIMGHKAQFVNSISHTLKVYQ